MSPIYRCSKPIADGSDNLKYVCKICSKVKSFQDSYLVRTVNNWNKSAFDLRNNDNLVKFKVALKEHLWLILVHAAHLLCMAKISKLSYNKSYFG